jgi:hypothetical protein
VFLLGKGLVFLGLARQSAALDDILAEHRDGLGHLTDFIRSARIWDLLGNIATRQLAHHAGHSQHRADHEAREQQSQNADHAEHADHRADGGG